MVAIATMELTYHIRIFNLKNSVDEDLLKKWFDNEEYFHRKDRVANREASLKYENWTYTYTEQVQGNRIDPALGRNHLQSAPGLQAALDERLSAWGIFHPSCGPVFRRPAANHPKPLNAGLPGR